MTDVSREHAAAVTAMIRVAIAGEAQGGRYKVYEGEVTDDEADVKYPYLIVWPPPVMRPTNTLAGYDGCATSTIQVTAAGSSPDEVLAALDRAAAALHRRRPQITGRVCAPITQVPGAVPPQPQRDDQVNTPAGRPVFFSFALFSLYSTAA